MASARTTVAIYYAGWTAVCATVAGCVVTAAHAAFFSSWGDAAGLFRTLWGDLATALALAAGQGVVALLAALGLAAVGRGLRATVLLGLALGVFDLGMYLVQMLVPATELGWGPDLGILAGVTALVTVAGVAPAGVRASGG